MTETKVKEANIFVRVKEEIKSVIHHDKSKRSRDEETYGRSDVIDENTPPINDVKEPNAFER